MHAGEELDMGCGTQLNIERGVVAIHSETHPDAVNSIFYTIRRGAHRQWIQAIIDSGAATSSALRVAAEEYEGSNYHSFVQDLRDAAEKQRCNLSSSRKRQLLRIFYQGPTAIRLALAQQSILPVEIERMLQLSPEAACGLTHLLLGLKVTGTYGEADTDVDNEEEP